MFCLFLLAVPASGQQTSPAGTQSPQGTSSTPAPQDPQAVSVLNQALSLAGGTPAITGIQDYQATGNITYPGTPSDLQGTVTVSGRGVNQVRIDASLPKGVRSWAVSGGKIAMKAEDGKSWMTPSVDQITISNAFPYQTPIFPSGLFSPFFQLASALNNPRFNIFYKGIVQVDGHSVHDIQVQRASPGSTITPSPYNAPTSNVPGGPHNNADFFREYNSIDYFIDVSTFQVLMIQNVVPRHRVLQVWYSNYGTVSGVLMPFSINEQAGAQTIWTIQLDQIGFNKGLQDSDFAL